MFVILRNEQAADARALLRAEFPALAPFPEANKKDDTATFTRKVEEWKKHLVEVTGIAKTDRKQLIPLVKKITEKFCSSKKRSCFQNDYLFIYFTLDHYWNGEMLDYAGGKKTESDFRSFVIENQNNFPSNTANQTRGKEVDSSEHKTKKKRTH